MSNSQARTACYDWHVSHNGRMVDFAGWAMPVQYSTIIKEHNAVRNAAGIFDVAHMGRLEFTGSDACDFLDHVVTCDVTQLEVGRVRYGLVTNEAGGVLDDILVSRGDAAYFMVVNASNRVKIIDWFERQRGGFDVCIKDHTLDTFMLALQGPKSIDILNPMVEADLADLRYYRFIETSIGGQRATVSRTGYTGELGFEIIVPSKDGVDLWCRLIDAGESSGLVPSGLGCRDTLRLEAAMPLYGHELDETTDPVTAGLSFAVQLDAGEFIGKSALREVSRTEIHKTRVGLELSGRRIARQGAVVLSEDQEIGVVTSGTFSPTLQRSIAMAYVESRFAEQGSQVDVDIRGKKESANIVALPFYKRSRS